MYIVSRTRGVGGPGARRAGTVGRIPTVGGVTLANAPVRGGLASC